MSSLSEIAGGGAGGSGGKASKRSSKADPMAALSSSSGGGDFDFDDPQQHTDEPRQHASKADEGGVKTKAKPGRSKDASASVRKQIRERESTRETRNTERQERERNGKGPTGSGVRAARGESEGGDGGDVESPARDTRARRTSEAIQYDNENIDDDFADSESNKSRKSALKSDSRKQGIRKIKPAVFKGGKQERQGRQEVNDEIDDETDSGSEEVDELDDVEEGGVNDEIDERAARRAERESAKGGKISEDLIAEARERGFDREDAEAFGSASALRKAIRLFDKQISTLGRDELKKRDEQYDDKDSANDGADTGSRDRGRQDHSTGKDSQGRTAAGDSRNGEAPGKKLGGSESRQDQNRQFKKLEINLKDWNEEAHPTLNAITEQFNELASSNSSLAEKNEELQRKLDGFLEHHNSLQRQKFTEDQDAFFDSIEEDYGDLFGSGASEDLDPDGDYTANRDKFIDEMNVYVMGLKAAKKSIPSLRKIRARVLSNFPGVIERDKEKIREETIEKVDRQKRIAVARPTNRKSRQELSHDDAATDFVESFYRDKGFAVAAADDDDFDGVI